MDVFLHLKKHILRFDHQQPYGIILADEEQPDPASYVVNYKEAAIERFLKGFGQASKNIAGHTKKDADQMFKAIEDALTEARNKYNKTDIKEKTRFTFKD